jgi:hypothetical protein
VKSLFEASKFASPRLTRRKFLRDTTLLSVGAAAGAHAAREVVEPFVQTVLGPIPASKLGFTLVHEHVMCDFIGAEQTNRSRWQVEAVVKRMLPVLTQLKERWVTGFIDCTPAYIGRDPRVLGWPRKPGSILSPTPVTTAARMTSLCPGTPTTKPQISSLTAGCGSGKTASRIAV